MIKKILCLLAVLLLLISFYYFYLGNSLPLDGYSGGYEGDLSYYRDQDKYYAPARWIILASFICLLIAGIIFTIQKISAKKSGK